MPPNRPGYHVISRKRIRVFLETHPTHASMDGALDRWYRIVKKATWANFGDVRSVYPTADVVGKFVVFNVAGNNIRIIAEIRYPHRVLYIRHVLTHSEYDRGDWKS